MNRIEQAYELVNRQQADVAVRLLEEGGNAGEADCWVELATWFLGGQIVPRDLGRSRECFRLAGEAGHRRARTIYVALLANGTGGPSDWQAAVTLLTDLAATDKGAADELDHPAAHEPQRDGTQKFPGRRDQIHAREGFDL